MLGYLLRRLGRAVITIIGISILVFIAARLSGDPTLHMLPEDASAKEVAQLRADRETLKKALAIVFAELK